jgi:phosphatidylethanolamine/phosphatidyl-N-methylethanolamine N-methyltransferase
MGLMQSSTNDAGRALSVAALDSRIVDQCYTTFASVYDRVWGRLLHAGRRQAMPDLQIQTGDRILEVGIGTGLTASLYPATCTVTGIDSSGAMLREAARQVESHRHIRLRKMDAQNLKFPDQTFDVVYAAYVISVVPDPVAALKEMCRVCRVGGHIVLLNHFLSENPVVSKMERLISPMTARMGFRADIDLDLLLSQAGLRPVSIRKVNTPNIWSLVRCRRDRN